MIILKSTKDYQMKNMIGERIKYFRICRGLSKEKSALLAEINHAFLGHLKRGLKSLMMDTFDRIIKALGVRYSEFFSDETDVSDT